MPSFLKVIVFLLQIHGLIDHKLCKELLSIMSEIVILAPCWGCLGANPTGCASWAVRRAVGLMSVGGGFEHPLSPLSY